jgi:hypothetical protein
MNIYDKIVKTSASLKTLSQRDKPKHPAYVREIQEDLAGLSLCEDVIKVMDKYIQRARPR